MVRGGEDTFLELKVKLSNPEKIAQEIVALANTGGGVIIFGVNDQLRIEGVDDPESVQEELVRICREDIEPPLFPFAHSPPAGLITARRMHRCAATRFA